MLRAFELTDIESLAAWANDPVTQDGIGEIHFPSSLEFHKSWVMSLSDNSLNQRFAVQIPDGSIIGISSIMNIDWRSRRAWHGLVLGDASHRGQGYGVDAIMATMRYAFDELNLNRLDGAIIEYNAASLATYLGPKIGWSEEGRRRQYYFRKGRYWDQIVVGVTAADYYSLVDRTQYWTQ